MIRTFARLDALLERSVEEGFDIGFRLQVVSESCWAGELRFTPEPNRERAPDRSCLVYSAGCGSAEEAVRRCLDEFEAWLSEGRPYTPDEITAGVRDPNTTIGDVYLDGRRVGQVVGE